MIDRRVCHSTIRVGKVEPVNIEVCWYEDGEPMVKRAEIDDSSPVALLLRAEVRKVTLGDEDGNETVYVALS